jgi:membrane-associated phospholipid phosphatase
MLKQFVTWGLRQKRHDPWRGKPAYRLTVEALEDRLVLSGDMVLRWNSILLAAIRNAGQNGVFATRTAAIVQAAVYDAVNSIDQSHMPYLVAVPAPAGADESAAAAQAAHDALVGLFPTQSSVLDLELKAALQDIADGDAKTAGIQVGQAAAQNILTARASDGSDKTVDYTPGTNPGDWQPTPPANGPAAFTQWPGVTPFALQSASQFRPSPPPALTSPDYTAAFDQVKDLGSFDSTTRTADQTEAALFWQGVATPNTGTVGLWNLVAQEVAVANSNSLAQNARLFALLDLAEADGMIANFDAKYTYNFWRPVTAIREADTDSNPDTDPDPNWTPLLATPSFPSYPSLHSTVSTAAATVLASFFGTDAVPFSLSWEGLPGVTRSYDSFSAAAHEAGQARIWAGFHYSFDVTAGEGLGQSVGAYIAQNFLQPIPSPPPGGAASAIPSGKHGLRTYEATLISQSGASGRPSERTGISPDQSGAGHAVGRSNLSAQGKDDRLRLEPMITNSTHGGKASHPWSAAAQLQTGGNSIDDVFASAASWEEHFCL